MRCRTCDRELDGTRVIGGRWVAVCPGCADRNEIRCPACRGSLQHARVSPRAEAFCDRCRRDVRWANGTLEVGEARPPTLPDASESHGGATPLELRMRPVGKALRIGRRAGAMRATGYRSTHRDGALTLERKVLHHDRAPDGPGWLVAAMVGSLAAPLIFFAAVVVWTVAKSALAGLLTGVFLSLLTAAPFVARRLLQYSRTRRAMRRGLHRPQRVRVDADGIHVDGESTVTSDRVAGLHVAERAGRYAVRARIGDGEERVLLDELDREDAALAQRELRAALRMSET